ncbi:MAG: hypothetical protein Q8P61_00185, partial [Candidatus Nanopelagicales bacterium]|nr:hypothetical protein [Candidatus Nanopelagicales bacterium]
LEAAFGYQIANRMDISFRPRSGDATKDVAEVRSKVAMQIADNNQLHWRETEVFADGMVEQRGYFEARMDFDDSILGEFRVTVLDPRDVIPDPDAKSYDPAGWSDVIVTRWMTLDDIEGLYGLDARAKAEAAGYSSDREDFGDDLDGAKRNKFGDVNNHDSAYVLGTVLHLRVIDRQKWVRSVMDVSVSQEGDVRPLHGDETPEVMDGLAQQGAHITKRRSRRVRWQVSTCDALLHDDWSPYDRFTVIPYFPFFRRGKTRGMVDNAIGPQKTLDKAMSQAIHIVNSTANSGWQLEQGQLTNMTTDDLETKGSSTGLILERKVGSAPLGKIPVNEMPRGIAELIQVANKSIQDVTVPDAMRGNLGEGESGIAIQSRQHASQQILSVPLDNLARTRHMLAGWIDYAVTKYYDTERVFRITKTDPTTGREEEVRLPINQMQADGSYLNDMTAGEYDTVITEQPMQVTFENSQFTQLMEMRKEGVQIPDAFVIRHSNVTDKHELIAAMETAGGPPPDPLAEAKAGLMAAQTKKVAAETVAKQIEADFSATNAAMQIASVPQIAPMADQLLKSAGAVDADQPPIVGGPPAGAPAVAEPAVPSNTSPNFPPRVPQPDVGLNTGIEGGKP